MERMVTVCASDRSWAYSFHIRVEQREGNAKTFWFQYFGPSQQIVIEDADRVEMFHDDLSNSYVIGLNSDPSNGHFLETIFIWAGSVVGYLELPLGVSEDQWQDVTYHVPAAIALDNLSVDESDAGAVIGALTVSDPDQADGHTFTVNDARFEIVAGELRLKVGESLDYENEASVTVTVTATDAQGLSVEEDFTIEVGNVAEGPGTYRFVGADDRDSSGFSVSSAGDVDEDGRADLLIGARTANGNDNGEFWAGGAYLIAAADLEALDAADGTVDGVIDLAHVQNGAASYRFVGVDGGDLSGSLVSSAGDVDGDGRAYLLIGARQADGIGNGESLAGKTYLIAVDDLEALDEADGAKDGVIDLSHVQSGAASYRFVGADGGDNSGWSVSSAGDVDRDGYADLLIGTPYADGNGEGGAGETYLISGVDLETLDAADGVEDGVIDLANVQNGTASYLFVGAEGGDESGWSASSAGDVNGDGYADLLIGADEADGIDNGKTRAGETYLISGADLVALDGADGTEDGVIDLANVQSGSASYRFVGAAAEDRFGGSVSSVVNENGSAYLLIGALSADSTGNREEYVGETYLIAADDLVALDAADGTTDGVIDLANVQSGGASYHFVGGDGFDYANGVSSAGDVDGDGRADLLIGASGADGIRNGEANSGETYLIAAADLVALDKADGTEDGVIDLAYVQNGAASYLFVGADLGDESGFSISSAGDVDGDGKADLLIGAAYADNYRYAYINSGETYLIAAADLEALDAADGVVDHIIDLANVRSMNEAPTAIALDNLSVDENDAGAVIGTLTVSDPEPWDTHTFTVDDARFEIVAGELRLKVGESLDYENEASVTVTVTATDAQGLTVDEDFTIAVGNMAEGSGTYRFVGADWGDEAGYSISSAGDVDEDGRADLLIGALRADGIGNGESMAGETYLIAAADLLVLDEADGIRDGVIDLANVQNGASSYRFVGADAYDQSGSWVLSAGSVSSAGDVDRDGVADLLIGAPGADGIGNGKGGAGETYLISGADLDALDKADGTEDGVIDLANVQNSAASYRFVGAGKFDRTGYSISSAGDVDRDGYADLLFGAYLADGWGNGETYLISGVDLEVLDKADGTEDGVIDLANVQNGAASYRFVGGETFDGTNSLRASGNSIASVGDVDNDGYADLLIGAPWADGIGDGKTNAGETYLISGVDLVALDQADGTEDGVIDLANVQNGTASYRFVGADAYDWSGYSVSSAGDVDKDGHADLLIGARQAMGIGNGKDFAGETYLISGAELVALDGADGTVDGVIDLANVQNGTASYRFVGADAYDGSGSSVSSGR